MKDIETPVNGVEDKLLRWLGVGAALIVAGRVVMDEMHSREGVLCKWWLSV